MNNIKFILDEISKNPRCEIYSPKDGLLSLPNEEVKYPNDLIDFYKQCDGVRLFEKNQDDVSFTIVPARRVIQANPIIVGEACENDISSTWYIICEIDNGEYLTIDLNKNRNGRCYDSNYEIHGVVGSCPIIANSFSELLIELYKSNGKDLFWINDEFHNKGYGDAYD
ncbi:Antitoxin YokJ [Photorhabdus australis subsp. thailandensis]|uniref:SMI1/KNR4 family protein n=2 Tax=Photorhabdus TaxID=29487 RepID=A0A329WS94_9GAMM|nr:MULTISPECIES: SMI1/KNR4 family protein [Photorhabdus]OCQ54135.1 Antitoxin YokJ [Photorhabdus australis subsp. thailandensis]RAX06815.1 SMI1/KNR4 family protein [Photorhabdus bodei]